MQRLFDVRQSAFNFSHDLDKVIHIKPPARRTGDDSYAARAQAERLHDLPGHAHFFLRLSRQRYANRVANAFVQQNAETNRGFDCAYKSRSCFSHAKMKWIVNFFREQAIRGNGAMNVRSLERNDNVGEVEVFEK